MQFKTWTAVGAASCFALPVAAGAATMTTKGFNEQLRLSEDGRRVMAEGPVACTAGARIVLNLTITQDGRIATGRRALLCSGKDQVFRKRLRVRRGRMVEGAARACGVITIFEGGEVTNTDGWCRAGGVTLKYR